MTLYISRFVPCIYTYFFELPGPSAPIIVNLTVVSPTVIYVQWQRPSIFYKRIDTYKIKYTLHGEYSLSREEVVPGAEFQVKL